MIELHTWKTPNGRKVSIMLEECGLEYTVHPVNLQEGEQHTEAFQALSPNGRIPAIRDTDNGITLMESGAILVYLAEKSGQFLAASGEARAKALEWTFWQMAGLGPMMGQASYFMNTAPEPIPYAINRYIEESARLIKVMDDRLAQNEYLAGDDYSIADMAAFPWVKLGFPLLQPAKPEIAGEGKHVARWIEGVGARKAVQAGLAIPPE
ncbi:MAG: glutathione S-transferase N-terminal domain-containing protein [Alphaproteobacteria bacterium]